MRGEKEEREEDKEELRRDEELGINLIDTALYGHYVEEELISEDL